MSSRQESRPAFEILEHTADIGFQAWGDDAGELFANAAVALQSVAVEMEGVAGRVAYPLAAAGEDYESLLVNFLNEVLYYLDGQRVVMGRFEIDRISSEEVSGRGWGEPRDAGRHPPKLVVKGVTYHQLFVREEGGRWTARVILDI